MAAVRLCFMRLNIDLVGERGGNCPISFDERLVYCAVSYTQLDVYKRQGDRRGTLRAPGQGQEAGQRLSAGRSC